MALIDLEEKAKKEEIAKYFDSLRKKETIIKEKKGPKGVITLEDSLTREERLTLDGVTALEDENREYKEELDKYETFFKLLKSLLPRNYEGPLA